MEEQKNTRCSIVMATYNGEKYIKEQIDSILKNMNSDDELIISDDGSTDKTREIINSFKDDRIKLIDGPKKGIKKNFENGINNATGEIIFLSDQDDIWMENKIAKVLEAFEKEDATLVIHDAEIVDENLDIIEESFFKYRNSGKGIIKNIWKNTYIGCCMAFKKEIKSVILPIPDNIEMHDQWIGINNEKNGKTYFLEEKLIKYRRHGGNVSSFNHYGIKRMLTNRIKLIGNYMERNNILDSIFQYLMAFFIILSVASVYDNLNNVNLYISEIFLVLIALINIYYIVMIKNKKIKDYKKLFKFLFVFIIIECAYIIIHLAIKNMNINKTFVYIAKMIIIFSLILNYLYLIEINNRKKNKEDVFWNLIGKISNIVVVIAFVSLILFLLGTSLKLIKPTGVVELNFGFTRSINSYFEVYFEPQATMLFGNYFYRNCGIFAEGPFYNIVLIISLTYELFINRKDNRKVKSSILVITILTTFSTLGIVIGAVLLVIKIYNIINRKIKNKKKMNTIVVIITIMIIALVTPFVIDKVNISNPSFIIRTDDFKASVLAFIESPVIGNGYQNNEPFLRNINFLEYRNNSEGQSSSLANIIVEGGILNIFIFIVPYILLLIQLKKEKNYNKLIFLLVYGLLFLNNTFAYSLLSILFLSYFWFKFLMRRK